jgi:hypothetical protein
MTEFEHLSSSSTRRLVGSACCVEISSVGVINLLRRLVNNQYFSMLPLEVLQPL